MTEVELAKELKKVYEDGAKNKEKTTMIHLFGIKYGEVIRGQNYTPKQILKYAEMDESYHVEINKGIKLAKYVEIKE